MGLRSDGCLSSSFRASIHCVCVDGVVLQIRVPQYKEPPVFLQLFDGDMVAYHERY